MIKNIYRAEIDGLRALAVISVIFFHAQFTIEEYTFFQGGFIGVDIFFVISGYLISLIIFKELIFEETFSFKNFYERRIRRIFPLLIFVSLVSSYFGWIFLLPDSFVSFSKTILYSLSFSSNFYFYFSELEYNNLNSLFKPFLHTWSLSIEEQFYLLFPITVFFIIKFYKKYLIYFLILFFITSLLIAELGSRNYTSLSFYLIHTRIWELLAGSILAYFEVNSGRKIKNNFSNTFLNILGFLLILFPIFIFNNSINHPSFFTLIPVVGVCLIIWFSEKKNYVSKLLSSKILTKIGLISYSLYLWHYPIFAFGRIKNDTLTDYEKLACVALTFFLSILSYLLIEKPFRKKNYKFKNISIVLIFFSLILIFLNLSVILSKGYKHRLPPIYNENFSQKPWSKLKNNNNEECHNYIERCKFNLKSEKKVYIIGDSIMSSTMFDLKDKITKKNYQFITSVVGGCLYFPGFDRINKKTNKINNKCNNKYFSNLKKTLLKEENAIIIIGGAFTRQLTSSNSFIKNFQKDIYRYEWSHKYIKVSNYDSIEESFKNEISLLSQKNKVILLYPFPEMKWSTGERLKSHLSKINKNNYIKIKKSDYLTLDYQDFKARNHLSFNFLDSLQGKNIYRVYPHKIFCNTEILNKCLSHDNKNIFYVDDSHLSSKGSEMINNLIIKQIDKIEFKTN